jgi:ornithine cyclodeaminase/alanine dehydrogenase-like protein (mu-crystallin family)
LSAKTDYELIAARSPRAVAEADIICTATTSGSPVFEDADIRPGAHINAIGAYRRDMCEIPPATLARALIIVDFRSSALEEAGDIIQAIKAGQLSSSQTHGELGEIASGKKPGRTSDDQITVFKSVGNASQDLVAAQRILVNAERIGLGVVLNL